MIDILVPVLGRPANAQPLVDSIEANTKHKHRIVFIVSPDDGEQHAAVVGTGACSLTVAGEENQYARKINEAARQSTADFLFLGADDLRFHENWDDIAIQVHEQTGKPVVGTNDLGNPTVMSGKHATHSLVHRSYVEQGTIDEPGKLLHEGYQHNWVDTEFVETAVARGAFVFAPHSHVEHLHPFWRKGRDDVIYERGRKDYHTDRRLFMQRRRSWRGRRV